MEMYERLKAFRKGLKLSQEKFGEKVGVSGDVIKNIELNRVEAKPLLISHICDVFSLNEEWLETGNGDAHIETKKSFVERLSAEYKIGDSVTRIIDAYLSLNDEQRGGVEVFFDTLLDTAKSVDPREISVDRELERATEIMRLNAANNNDTEISASNDVEALEAEADAFAQLAREQFLLEKKQESKALFVKKSGAG